MNNKDYMMKYIDKNEQLRYEDALRKVKKIKSFYIHLLVYIVINCLIIIGNYKNLKVGESYFQLKNFYTAFFWGIGLVIHGLRVYLPSMLLGENWEKRKIQEFIEEEKNNLWE